MLELYYQSVPKNVKVHYSNDNFFDLHLREVKFDKNVIDLIQKVENTAYIGNLLIESKYFKGLNIGVENISTGCKTAINVYSFPDKMFFCGEAGPNALSAIFSLGRGKCFISDVFVVDGFVNPIKVFTKGEVFIVKNDIELIDLLFNSAE